MARLDYTRRDKGCKNALFLKMEFNQTYSEQQQQLGTKEEKKKERRKELTINKKEKELNKRGVIHDMENNLL